MNKRRLLPDTEKVLITSLTELADYMDDYECGASLMVHPRFGPESMESFRKITFYLDDKELVRNDLTKALETRLSLVAGLPETSENYAYFGEADFRKSGTCLYADFHWTKSIPYDDPCETKSASEVIANLGPHPGVIT